MRITPAETMSDSADRPGRWASDYHAPVMVAEVVGLLGAGGAVLDGTLGGGGHSAALLEAGCAVAAFDRDSEAVRIACERLGHERSAGRFRAFVANYADIDSVESIEGERFSGVLLDLGVSSHQLDDPHRGFSFRPGAPLDMRMGADAEATAAEVLNEADEHQLIRIFREYADEPRAARLAREIQRRRATRPFVTSDDLVGAIRAVLGARSGPADFARLFQAVRIEVNEELTGLARALPVLRERLTPGGVFAVIAYHSGEDRLVKQTFREWSTACTCPPKLPRCVCGGVALGEVVTRRPVTASPAEVTANPRARSARLRAWRSAE
ncbi:MAG TPA: 16S rRNA (cytosine(1402)-N(4))-methyltransferase RsmH [Gemmatimonadaceae bacterium]|nr:16S rRNA (cytosine(1402)-N(4))-methyltransferase RsmH [Gemmatimonadaceae bacterium]